MGLLLMIYGCENSYFARFKKRSLSILVAPRALLKRLIQSRSLNRYGDFIGHHGDLVWNVQKIGEKQL